MAKWFLQFLLLIFSSSVFAQSADVEVCKKNEDGDGLAACTRLINTTASPDDRSIYLFNRGLIYAALNENCPAAEADLKEAIRIRKSGRLAYTFYRFHISLGRLYRDCYHDYDRAIDTYTAATKIGAGATVSQPYLERASVWSLKGDVRNQMKDFETALSFAKDDFRYSVLLQKAIAERRNGDFVSALKTLDLVDEYRGEKKASFEADVEINLGAIFEAKGDLDSALRALDKAERASPRTADIYNNRGLILIRKNDLAGAIREISRAIELDGTSLYLANRGRAYRLAGDLAKSMIDLDKAVSVRPVYSIANLHRAQTLHSLGRLDEAIAELDRAIKRSPEFMTAFTERGLIFEEKRMPQQALQDFRKALSINRAKDDSVNESRATAKARVAALEAAETHNNPPPISTSIATPVEPPSIMVSPGTAKPQGRRVALVIGNGTYEHTRKLPNPVNDAKAIAAAIKAVGFDEVTELNDLSKERLIAALRSFADSAERADWAMVYYAGHGLEMNGMNYLIPVDARLATDRDVQYEAVSTEQVFTAIGGAKKIGLVILDACRNNPLADQMRRTLATRSIGRGLGRVDPTGATLVVFSAKHGQEAQDGSGANSPFALSFLQRMTAPNVDISKVFRLVRDDVLDATAGQQEPFTYGSLPGREDFYFVSTRN